MTATPHASATGGLTSSLCLPAANQGAEHLSGLKSGLMTGSDVRAAAPHPVTPVEVASLMSATESPHLRHQHRSVESACLSLPSGRRLLFIHVNLKRCARAALVLNPPRDEEIESLMHVSTEGSDTI